MTRCIPDFCYLHSAATISVQTVTDGITSSVSANHAERQRCIGLNVAGWRQPSMSFICLPSFLFTLGWQASPHFQTGVTLKCIRARVVCIFPCKSTTHEISNFFCSLMLWHLSVGNLKLNHRRNWD